ncbi:DUF2890 domain-containing protein, partial [bacterium M00.F.Ca.ET.191.01.1.1]
MSMSTTFSRRQSPCASMYRRPGRRWPTTGTARANSSSRWAAASPVGLPAAFGWCRRIAPCGSPVACST